MKEDAKEFFFFASSFKDIPRFLVFFARLFGREKTQKSQKQKKRGDLAGTPLVRDFHFVAFAFFRGNEMDWVAAKGRTERFLAFTYSAGFRGECGVGDRKSCRKEKKLKSSNPIKSQIPMTKIQKRAGKGAKLVLVWELELGHWVLTGIWGLGIWSFCRASFGPQFALAISSHKSPRISRDSVRRSYVHDNTMVAKEKVAAISGGIADVHPAWSPVRTRGVGVMTRSQ